MNRHQRFGALVLASALVLGGVACGSSGSEGGSDGAADTVDDGAPVTGAPGSDPLASTTTVAAPTECAEATGLGAADGEPTDIELPATPPTDAVEVTVLTEGDGPEVTDASYATVNYVGIACSSGEVFDSSWRNGQTITAALGTAAPTDTAFNVIPGWTDGLVGQKQGSLVQLDIPPALGYGEYGSPPVIGANEPLTFVVELVEVSETAP
jgi:hypothetical protein